MPAVNRYTADLEAHEPTSPTDEDHRRADLDVVLLSPDTWFKVNCYMCGMRQIRPIHQHCFEDGPGR